MSASKSNIEFKPWLNTLSPDSVKIDGRNDQQALAFAANFARLINFYDKTNTKNGNWQPFLLKDPIVLLAFISQTNYSNSYNVFLAVCQRINFLIQKSKTDQLSEPVNKVFNILESLFVTMNTWVSFMLKDHKTYNLKSFLVKSIEEKMGSYLWALLKLRQNLTSAKIIKPEGEFDESTFTGFNEIWQTQKNSYTDVLNLNVEISLTNMGEITQSIKNTGNEIFELYAKVIKNSTNAYENITQTLDNYPDTTLLISFVKLLEIHRNQLNGITKKHLDLYYKNILKQAPKFAEPDEAYVNLTLAKNSLSFNLPIRTQFNAGIDNHKKPIIFETVSSVNLNQAAIKSVQAQWVQISNNRAAELITSEIKSANKIQKNEDGSIKSWNAFGGKAENGKINQVGFSIASPMFYLLDGTRSITIEFIFEKEIDKTLFTNATYLLSTEKKWYSTTLSTQTKLTDKQTSAPDTENLNTLTLNFELKPTEPSIVPFKKCPDGINSQWPLFKVLLSNITDLSNPPTVHQIKITTNVQGLNSFEYYNSKGKLSNDKPFLPYGPIPELNELFFIGSSEIFSKPTQKLDFTISWDHLPKKFSEYYKAYNIYLGERSVEGVIAKLDKKSQNYIKKLVDKKLDKAEGNIIHALKTIADEINKITVKKNNSKLESEPNIEPLDIDTFNNKAFTVDTKILFNENWEDFIVSHKEDISNINPITLFEQDKDFNLVGTTKFYYNEKYQSQPPKTENNNSGKKKTVIVGDPGLILQPLTYSKDSKSGFISLNLSNPDYAFGNLLYPKVVSKVTMENALIISKKERWLEPIIEKIFGEEKIKDLPNEPFVPKIKTIVGNYTASYSYNLNKSGEAYPVNYYQYTPNGPFQIIPPGIANSEVVGDANTITSHKREPVANNFGIPLFYSIPFQGSLFIGLDKVIAPCTLTLYFELVPEPGNKKAPKNAIIFQYLSGNTWRNLEVLQDETNALSCSGIITILIPQDITYSSEIMPDNNYWVSLSVKNNTNLYSSVVYLNTQVVKVIRTGNDYLLSTVPPELPANKITSLVTKTPEIATVIQPFASVNGKPYENEATFYERVSTRLRTKNRASNNIDLNYLVTQEFTELYFAKSINTDSNTVELAVLKKYKDWREPNAFRPSVYTCFQEKVETYLKNKISPFVKLNVLNFSFQVVQVTCEIIMDVEGLNGDLKNAINQQLMLLLSPWITCEQNQITIGKGISKSNVLNFLQKLPAVIEVENLTISSWLDEDVEEKILDLGDSDTFFPQKPSYLFVTAINHNLTLKVNV